jgi:large subunit ribosomal protein L30
MMAKVRITQVRSRIGQSPRHRAALRTLGLRRINHFVERDESESLAGQLRLINHLVRVEPVGATKE